MTKIKLPIPTVIARSKRWSPVANLVSKFFDLPVWKVLVQYTPYTEAQMLEHLASELELLDTEAWQRAQSDKERRSIIDQAHERHRTRGTDAGLKQAVAEAGGEIRSIIAPPHKFFASPSPSPVERNAWLSQHPEIRLYTRREPGQAGFVSFAGRMFPGYKCFPVRSDAHFRSRVKATFVKDGVETPLETNDVEIASKERQTTTTVLMPGTRGSRTFVGAMFPGYKCFPVRSDAASRCIQLTDVALYREVSATRSLRTIQPGLKPIDADGEMIAETHTTPRRKAFAGRMFAGVSVMTATVSHLYHYRRIKLHDPSARLTRARAASHVGVTRLGMPAHHAHVLVALFGKRNPLWGRFAGQPVVEGDRKPLQRVIENMRIAKRESDVITISTKIYKPLVAGWHVIAGPDVIAGQTTQK